MFRPLSPGHHQVTSNNNRNLRKLDTVIHKNESDSLKMQRDPVVVILYGIICNQYKHVKMYNCKYHKIISVGYNFVFIYISLSVGVWWRVGNTKLLKHENIIAFEFVLFQYTSQHTFIHRRYDYSHLINPLKPELIPICYLLALLGAHHFLHVSRIRVKLLTFRLLMSYIYGAPILDVSRSHTTTQGCSDVRTVHISKDVKPYCRL
jgi:hypothetical protein